MNDNEIIKALGNCLNHYTGCGDCPIRFEGYLCKNALLKQTLDLINRLQAEKEALINGQEILQKYIAEQKAEIERKDEILNSYALQYGTVKGQSKKIAEIKSAARKEFAERLKDKAKQGRGFLGNAYSSVDVEAIDNLLAEMDRKEKL